MKTSNLLIVAFMAVGIAILSMLGTWQVQRLFWKEDLIATVEARTKLQPMEINEFLDRQMLEDNWPYSPIMLSGTFDHSKEVFYYTTMDKVGAGWNVHTPLKLENGKYVIVNRGFIPFDFKDQAKRNAGQVTGLQTITGLVRVPLTEKPNSFVPDNALDKREFYWKSYDQMVSLMGTGTEREFVPFLVDANDAPNPGGLPVGGTTIVDFPNNHLQYAVTWYGLALTLLGVGSYFLYTRRRNSDD